MATMNISLPDDMKRWVEDQSQSGRYGNASDYVRDLIRKDQDKKNALAELQALITEGIESGISDLSREDVLRIAHERFAAKQRA